MIKKIHNQVKEHLQKEVNSTHVFIIVILPIVIFISLFAYVKAVSTDFFANAPIHTRIVYYDGIFSQDLAIDTIDTSVYMINQSSENILASVYEYNDSNTNNNTVTLINIPKFTDKLMTTVMPSLVILTNESQTSTSTILVGENNRIDKDRLIFLENSIYKQILGKNINEIKYAFQNLRKIYKIDINVKSNCTKIVENIANKANEKFGNKVARAINDDFCSDTYKKTLNRLTPSVIDIKNNVLKYGNTIEITLPNLNAAELLEIKK